MSPQGDFKLNILVAGNKKIIIPSLIKFLLSRGHHVVMSGSGMDNDIPKKNNLITYPYEAADDFYSEMFKSHSFDLVIYNASDESGLISKNNTREIPVFQNGLDTILAHCDNTGVKEFFLISSTRVYGNNQAGLEEEIPVPDSAYGQKLLNDENLCRFYAKNKGLQVSILRVPFIYGISETGSFVEYLVQSGKETKKISLAVGRYDSCQFLHMGDLQQFFSNLLENDERKSFQVLNLVSDCVNFAFVEQLWEVYFPKSSLSFLSQKHSHQPPLKISIAKAEQQFGWQPQHSLSDDLHVLIEGRPVKRARENLIVKLTESISKKIKPFLAWIEVILGASLMHLLTIWTETIIEFKYIDYRLLFVVIIGSTHGLLFGLVASLFAILSAVVRWTSIGLDWELLVYNVENWIPFALYFLAGSVTGYVHDKSTNDILFERNQTRLILEKYEFLYHLYNEIGSIKDRLREQLVGYRDSFGRLFRVANELNDFEEDSIFLKALEILEDLMKNDQIAIYTVDRTGTFGRLEVKSASLKQQIPKSILMTDYSVALGQLKIGEIFQNKEILANYPAYIAPIIDQGMLIGLVILWDAKFEQFTLYYSNLFKVITGLIQSALVRAAIFKNTQSDEIYLPSARILKPEAFKQALALKKKMKRSRVSEFLIISIEKEEMQWKELYARLKKGTRDDDVIGILNETDDHCYVLLSNAGIENLEIIQKRLSDLGLKCAYVEDLEIE